MSTAGATKHETGNEDDISTENSLQFQLHSTLMEFMNQGISASMIRDFAEKIEHRV